MSTIATRSWRGAPGFSREEHARHTQRIRH